MYNLRLPYSRKTYFNYYEKTLVEEKWEELVENKVVMHEKPNEMEDIILSDEEIIDENAFIEDYGNFIPKTLYFYNLTMANKLYGEDFIVEILYYAIQRYLRNIIDHIEEYQKKKINVASCMLILMC
jgi:hypothetical protein